MSAVNKVILMGNVGKDPDIKRLENGVLVVNFPLATTETFRDKFSGEKKEQTEWHNIIAWRKIAESVEKSELKKGDRVYLEGKMKNRKWKDKDGNQRSGVEIVCETFTIVNRKKNGAMVEPEVETETESTEQSNTP